MSTGVNWRQLASTSGNWRQLASTGVNWSDLVRGSRSMSGKMGGWSRRRKRLGECELGPEILRNRLVVDDSGDCGVLDADAYAVEEGDLGVAGAAGDGAVNDLTESAREAG